MPTHTADVDLDALLLDGRIVRIRTVQAADAQALWAMHDGVSADTLYLRFFSLSRAVVPEEIEALTRLADDDHGSLLAEIGGHVVAVATFERLHSDRTRAEIAFLVDDTHRGRGIGTLLQRSPSASAHLSLKRWRPIPRCCTYSRPLAFR